MVLVELFESALSVICYIVNSILSFFGAFSSVPSVTRKSVTFDNGKKVKIGKKVAEGGFSLVFEAFDAITNQKFALKRINCSDSTLVRACRSEAHVHRLLDHPNLLPLVCMKFDVTSSVCTVCYMLFPFLEMSLREEINRRKLLRDDVSDSERNPFGERELIILFSGIIDGLQSMHYAGLAHRDLKVENVMLAKNQGGRGLMDPILMDFGSARPLNVKLKDRRTVVTLVEEACTHSTITYRAPELFEGGCRHGDLESDIDGRVDVWSLGCVLFAMMYGASPFEVEFRTDGSVRIVDCTQLKVLNSIKFPLSHTEAGKRYSNDLKEVVNWMLNVDRNQRPTIDAVSDKIDSMLNSLGAHSVVQSRKNKNSTMESRRRENTVHESNENYLV